MRLKLRRWVKVLLFFILIIVLVVSIKDIFTKKTIIKEKGKDYICYGSIIELCHGVNYEID